RPPIVSAVTSAGVPTTWIAPATLLRSSVPSTPTTSMSPEADFTHTCAPRGTCTSSSARPVTTSLRTLAVPAAARRPGPRPDTARLSTSHPITWIRPEGLMMRTDPSAANGQRSPRGGARRRASAVRCARCAVAVPGRRRRGRRAPALRSPTMPCASYASSCSARRRRLRGPAQQLDLLPRRRRDQPPQLDVPRVAGQGLARLTDRRVDDAEVALEQRHRGGLEPVALGGERC